MSDEHIPMPTDGLQNFQSIKIVRAGEITEVVPAGCYVQEADPETQILRIFPPNMTARYEPKVGDFWVVYDDGYQAISPREPFLAGYVAMEAPDAQQVTRQAQAKAAADANRRGVALETSLRLYAGACTADDIVATAKLFEAFLSGGVQ